MHKKLLKLATWKKILTLVTLGVVLFVVWFVCDMFTDKPPNFFPLNDLQAEYRITKNCPNGQGWIEQTHTEGNAYCLEYRGDNVLVKEDHDNSTFFSITIGKSYADLENYLGKKVINIKGKFTTSGKQCIQDTCIDIGGPFVVVNIDGLEVAK